MNSEMKAIHINATKDDIRGNNGIGRYILLPGSDGRAEHIASHFSELEIKKHPRAHNLYIGKIEGHQKPIDIGVISTGMGTASAEIVMTELYMLGAKRFLRIGTAGSLQPERIDIGDFVIAQGTVRDEHATCCYMPPEFPALASFEMIGAAHKAARNLQLLNKTHTGIVHCKDSLYGRQFARGPMHDDSLHYMQLMQSAGVLATEMETASIFVLSSLFDHELRQKGNGLDYRVLSGAVLAIASSNNQFAPSEKMASIEHSTFDLAFETIRNLAREELIDL